MKSPAYALPILILLVGCSDKLEDASLDLSKAGNFTVCDYRSKIDPDDSYLLGHVHLDAIHWELRVEAEELEDSDEDEDIPEDKFVPWAAPSLYIFFRSPKISNWREISGFSENVKYDKAPKLLQDSPTGAYVGWHLSPMNHSIAIGRNEGHLFELHWTCVAVEDEWTGPYDFAIDGSVEFRGMYLDTAELYSFEKSKKLGERSPRRIPRIDIRDIPSSWKPNSDIAIEMLALHVETDEFEEPAIEDQQVLFSVR